MKLKPSIKIENSKLKFPVIFAEQYIKDKEICSVITTADGYAVGFFDKETDIPLALRDVILEVKNNPSNGTYVNDSTVANHYKQGNAEVVPTKVGANQDLYFIITQ